MKKKKTSSVRRIINKYIAINDIGNISNLAKLTGICRQTLYDKMEDPGLLRVSDIRMLNDVLHFEDADLVLLVKGE